MSLRRKRTNWPLAGGIIVVLAILSFSVLFITVLAFTFPPSLKVGVVPIKGTLMMDTVDSYIEYQPGVQHTIALIEEADADSEVAVILLDINSGGGSLLASKELMRAIKNTNKPVVAYIGEVGASGAYYAASAADEIVCDEDSFTGSIGVLSTVPNYQGLFEKIGVNMTVLKRGEFKTMGNPYDEFTAEEQEMFMVLLEDAYSSFRRDVLANRPHMDVAKFDAVADGRILNGRQAYESGLVDYLGSRDFALQRAATLAGIEGEPEEKQFFSSSSPLDSIFGQAGYSFGQGFITSFSKQTELTL